MAEADPALLIADDHQRGEAEAPAALDHLGHAVDVHELVDKLAVALFAVSVLAGLVPPFAIRDLDALEVQARLAGRIGRAP